ncbi:MAG: FAD-binding protein [Victivallales bacterium]|jgi:electron transfer flavoprotein alpha subunit|nr:FAD-binding protein [Victivallales bacterium]
MAFIKIHQEKAENPTALVKLCPFGAIHYDNGKLDIDSGCKMCRICIKKGGGVFEYVEEKNAPAVDKSAWRGVAVVAEQTAGAVHPITFELLGKARDLADKINHPVYCVLIGYRIADKADELLSYGADEVFVYDDPALEHFRIEPYTAVLEDFINKNLPSTVLVGGTTSGRSLAPRVAARFRTGLTADCTKLDMQPSTDLDQIRPAYGGNIMAHINTPKHRPQFATVRYKIFPIPPKREAIGKITRCSLANPQLNSAISVQKVTEKKREVGIEEAEVIVVAGRGIRKQEDLAMLEELAGLLGGKLASTRSLIEAGWVNPRCQIGLSGRTVKPKLIITCGVSGAIQFVAGMSGSELIVAINTDPNAAIFKSAHIGIHGDLYKIVPQLIEKIKLEKGQ